MSPNHNRIAVPLLQEELQCLPTTRKHHRHSPRPNSRTTPTVTLETRFTSSACQQDRPPFAIVELSSTAPRNPEGRRNPVGRRSPAAAAPPGRAPRGHSSAQLRAAPRPSTAPPPRDPTAPGPALTPLRAPRGSCQRSLNEARPTRGLPGRYPGTAGRPHPAGGGDGAERGRPPRRSARGGCSGRREGRAGRGGAGGGGGPRPSGPVASRGCGASGRAVPSRPVPSRPVPPPGASTAARAARPGPAGSAAVATATARSRRSGRGFASPSSLGDRPLEAPPPFHLHPVVRARRRPWGGRGFESRPRPERSAAQRSDWGRSAVPAVLSRDGAAKGSAVKAPAPQELRECRALHPISSPRKRSQRGFCSSPL